MDYDQEFDRIFDVEAIIGAEVDFDDDALTLPEDELFDDEDDY